MPPHVALVVYALFMVGVIYVDRKGKEEETSHALWLPLAWLFLVGSKYPSEWLYPNRTIGGEIYLEGSPLDRNIFLALMVIGIIILHRRDIDWSKLIRDNKWIFIFFLYCGLSAFWSDYPFISLKRWIKGMGNLVMILVIMTEHLPLAAMKTVMRRLAYTYIPVSMLVIKYFPAMGRQFDPWTGQGMYIGAATSKNSLGNVCMTCGVFMFWSLLSTLALKNPAMKRRDLPIQLFFMLLIVWLQLIVESATSLACLVIAIVVITAITLARKMFNMRSIGVYVFLFTLTLASLQLFFDIVPAAVELLGRDASLTGRTDLWHDVVTFVSNPLLGTGYETFWLGERLDLLWEVHWWRPNQAHNGYIEIYLNLGWIGLALLAGLIVSCYRRANRSLAVNYDYARVQFAFLVIALLYNITEAAFKGLSLVWILFLMISMKVPEDAFPATSAEEAVPTTAA